MQPVQALLQADGNSKLAAERLNVPEAVLLQELSTNLAEFQIQVRTALLTQLFGTWLLVQGALKIALPDLEPKEIAKTFNNLSATLVALTEPVESGVRGDLFNSILSMLPPEQQEAFRALTAKTIQQ